MEGSHFEWQQSTYSAFSPFKPKLKVGQLVERIEQNKVKDSSNGCSSNAPESNLDSDPLASTTDQSEATHDIYFPMLPSLIEFSGSDSLQSFFESNSEGSSSQTSDSLLSSTTILSTNIKNKVAQYDPFLPPERYKRKRGNATNDRVLFADTETMVTGLKTCSTTPGDIAPETSKSSGRFALALSTPSCSDSTPCVKGRPRISQKRARVRNKENLPEPRHRRGSAKRQLRRDIYGSWGSSAACGNGAGSQSNGSDGWGDAQGISLLRKKEVKSIVLAEMPHSEQEIYCHDTTLKIRE